MKIKKDISRLLKKDSELNSAINVILNKVQSVCDFKLHLENVPGDGWCFSSELSGFPLYMTMESVLKVVMKKGKFIEKDWIPFS